MTKEVPGDACGKMTVHAGDGCNNAVNSPTTGRVKVGTNPANAMLCESPFLEDSAEEVCATVVCNGREACAEMDFKKGAVGVNASHIDARASTGEEDKKVECSVSSCFH